MRNENGSVIPASVEAAWGLRPRPHKGPRRGLSLERVVGAAVEVADAEGLDAVSMSRVAERLGASTMSLYRYVATKDELVMLMADTAVGPPPPLPEGLDWRAGLTRWATAMRTAMYAHPWAVQVPITGPPISPNQLAWLDQALRVLRDTGLEEGEQVFVALLVSGQVRMDVQLATSIAGNPRAAALTAEYGAFVLRATEDGRLPDLRRVAQAGVFDDAADDMGMDTEFDFGLARVLDGVEVFVRSRAGRPE